MQLVVISPKGGSRNMKLFISDKDGSLLDSLSTFYEGVVRIFRHYELNPPTLDDYRDHIAPDFMPFYWDRGIPLYVTAHELNRIRIACSKESQEPIRPHPGAKELLLHCRKRGFNLFIATADVHEVGDPQLRDLGMRESLWGWARGGNSRRDDLLDICAFANGFTANGESLDIWYLDDTASGIEAAKSASLGIHTIGFTGGFNSREKLLAAEPDHLVDSLLEIPMILDAYALYQSPAMQKPWAIN